MLDNGQLTMRENHPIDEKFNLNFPMSDPQQARKIVHPVLFSSHQKNGCNKSIIPETLPIIKKPPMNPIPNVT